MTLFWLGDSLLVMANTRTLSAIIEHERKTYHKMIFISGPRQVGKTTVLRHLSSIFPGPLLNWDNLEDRARISKNANEIFASSKNVYFDEIHKTPRWKNFLKGYFDKYGDTCQINVTGSARLDVYRRGGDSLLGRYILFRLHPFTVGELLYPGKIPSELTLDALLSPDNKHLNQAQECWTSLFECGPFPEPFLKQSVSFSRRWRTMRHERLVREDIRDLTRIRELALLEKMVALIPDRIAQPFSLNALREDLEVSHDSIRLWTQALEDFYYLYFISPFSKKLSRALKKERKVYLWDYSEVQDPGARYENMVASHLLAWSHRTRDLGQQQITLSYVRNKQKEEVDFLIQQENKPLFLIEAKLNDRAPNAHLLKFSRHLGNLPVLQLVHDGGVFEQRKIDGVLWTVLSASSFFKTI